MKITNTYDNYQDINQKNSTIDKKKLNIFNIFNQEEKKILDTNKDNKISFNEIKNYITSNNSNTKILNKIANTLGIEIDTPINFDENIQFKQDAISILNSLGKIDNNKDNFITLQEIKTSTNISSLEKSKINRIFGLVDGKFENKQGTFGSCWALCGAYGIYAKNIDTFKKIVKSDNEGNAIVTFLGDEGENFSTKIDREIIQGLLKLRTQKINYNILNPNNEYFDNKYYSSDPDAIAIELAFQNYDKHIKNLQREQNKNILNYINNSIPLVPNKPEIKNITKDMSNEDLANFLNYYHNSSCKNKNLYTFPHDVKYLTPQTLSDMKKYLQESNPIFPEKPSKNDINSNFIKVINYIKNSKSATISKPEIKIYTNQAGSIIDGGHVGAAIKLMLGGSLKIYDGGEYNFETEKYEEIPKEEKNNIKKILQNIEQSNQIFSISFRETDKRIFKNHGYTIIGNDDKNILLVNPHDTTKEPIIYPINKAIKNLKKLEINTIPEFKEL